MASGTTTRRKHNVTVTKMGREIADDLARVKKCGNRKYGPRPTPSGGTA